MNRKQRETILGLDITPGERNNPIYAAVIIDTNGLKIFESKVKRSELMDIIKRFNVRTIAIDNIFELFPTSSEIMNFLRKTRVKLVQVTGPLGKETKLSHLAKIHGLSQQSKLSPSKAAEISAKLVLKGVGSEIKIFEDITEIAVTRTRSLGEGGQHQSKYARVIASVIQRATREIADMLDKHNLKYDLFYREGDYGFKNAKFIVYAPFDTVKRVVDRYHGDLFKIDLKPIETKRLVSLPSSKVAVSRKLLICGIDPGETTGLAILDLSGRVLHVESRKNFGLMALVERIYELGRPLIVATDVPKTPQFVEKLCSKTGAICFNPKHPISISEKNELLRQLGVDVANSHERDALIAALVAYKKYRNLFQKIDSILSYLPIKLNEDAIKKEVVQGKSVREVIRKQFERRLSELISFQEPGSVVRSKTQVIVPRALLEERERLRQKLATSLERIRELEKRVSNLESELREKDLEINRLRNLLTKKEVFWRRKINEKIEELKDDYTQDLERRISEFSELILIQKNKIAKLEQYVENLKQLLRKKENQIPIKRLRKFNREDIDRLSDLYGILPGDIIYIVDPSGGGRKTAYLLIEKKIKAIIVDRDEFSNDSLKVFEEHNIPILHIDDFEERLDLENDISFITIEQYNKAIRNMKFRTLPEDEAITLEIETVLNDWRRKRLDQKGEEE